VTTAEPILPTHVPALVEGTARVGPIPIPQVLREFGIDPIEVITSVGVDPALFDDPDNRLAFRAVGQLMGACVARTGCPHFGLLVGQRSGLNSLGLPGLLIQHSPDVGAALRSLVTHLYLQDRGAVPTLAVEGKRVSLGYAIYEPGVENAGQIMDAAAAIGWNVLRGLCGPRWAPTEVQLAHRRPADVQPYRRFFRAPVRFDAPHNVLVFSATWLRQRLNDASAELQRLLHEEVKRITGRRAVAFADQVRRVVRAAMVSHDCSAEAVARTFSIQRRTLSRRLSAEGTTFEAVLGEVRYEVARQLLGQTNTPVEKIADTLGYSDAPPFIRAFRRWSGMTPGRWRSRNASGSG
jgi:AraC-like DNA-binding protein